MFSVPTALALLVLGLALVGGCATTPSTSPEAAARMESATNLSRTVAAGEAALKDRRYDDALQQFQRVLRLKPDHVRGRLGLAETYLSLGAPTQAATLFDQLREVSEVRAEAAQGAGIARVQTNELEAARALLREVTDANPQLWRAWNALARSYDLEQRWRRSAGAYAKALDATQEPAVVHNNWGMSLLAQGEYVEAAQHFSQALQHDAESATAKTNLRLALAYQARYAEALAGVDRQELPQALNNVGYIALVQGDLQRAEAYFLRALEQSPSFYEAAAKNLQLLGSMREIEAVAPADS